MYKYKVLVADDEYWSRMTLKNLAPWEEYKIEFLEPACDGREVLERIPKEKPDIVITDINMPFVDGLELLNSIGQEHKEIVTIAVSGYDDFDKVKGTFKAGGIDYLLKPVGKDQLKEVIEKAIDKLEDNSTKEADSIKNSKELEYATSAIVDSEKSALLTAQLYGGETETEGMLLNCSLFVKLHDIDGLSKKYNFKIHEMSYDIKQRILKVIKNLRPDIDPLIFCFSPKVNEFLVCMDVDSPFLKRVANEILMEFAIDKNGPVTVVIHQKNENNGLGNTYREMIASLMTRKFSRTHSIITVDKTSNVSGVRKISKTLEKAMQEAIEKGKLKELERLVIDETGINSSDDGTWTLYDVAQISAQLFSILLPAKTTAEEMTDIRDEIDDSIRYDRMKLCREELIADLQILCKFVCEDREEDKNTSIDDVIKKIHERIENKFNEHITLSTLAEEFFIDPSYISRTFSKKYGETIMACITRIRIEKAVELIKEGRNSLEEISFEVGYDDYNYFSRVFKKQTGIRPTEYKALNKN